MKGMRQLGYDKREQRRNSNKGSRLGYFLSGLIGVILGAILVIGVFPNFSTTSDISDNNGEQQKISKINQNVSVDVTTAVTDAYDVAGDAVVGITNIQEASFFSQSGEAGTGSGVVYKKENGKAYIVTNHHVVEGATSLEVSLADGTKVPANLLGSDVWTDLAVVQINDKDVKTVIEFGNSESLKPGEPVIAIGNPLGLQFSGSVTQGIISGLERMIEMDIDSDGVVDWNAEVIQTDAAINPGNSGGALVNLQGQLIGINSMKIAQSAVEGIGLAIPVNSVIPIIEDIEQYGEVKRPYMGVSIAPVAEITQYHRENTFRLPADVKEGVAIIEVVTGSPADRAGLQAYDVMVEMDGEPIPDMAAFRTHLYEEKVIGEQVEVKYYRNGKIQTTKVSLMEETM